MVRKISEVVATVIGEGEEEEEEVGAQVTVGGTSPAPLIESGRRGSTSNQAGLSPFDRKHNKSQQAAMLTRSKN
jgi:hypothetical protein